MRMSRSLYHDIYCLPLSLLCHLSCISVTRSCQLCLLLLQVLLLCQELLWPYMGPSHVGRDTFPLWFGIFFLSAKFAIQFGFILDKLLSQRNSIHLSSGCVLLPPPRKCSPTKLSSLQLLPQLPPETSPPLSAAYSVSSLSLLVGPPLGRILQLL